MNEENSSNDSDKDNEKYMQGIKMIYDPNTSDKNICIEL